MNRSLSRRSWRKVFSMFLGTLQKRFSFPCHSASTQHILKSLTSFPHFPHFPQLTYSSLLSLADVQTCSAGDIFGELALLYNCPRAARNSVADPVLPLWGSWQSYGGSFPHFHRMADTRHGHDPSKATVICKEKGTWADDCHIIVFFKSNDGRFQ